MLGDSSIRYRGVFLLAGVCYYAKCSRLYYSAYIHLLMLFSKALFLAFCCILYNWSVFNSIVHGFLRRSVFDRKFSCSEIGVAKLWFTFYSSHLRFSIKSIVIVDIAIWISLFLLLVVNQLSIRVLHVLTVSICVYLACTFRFHCEACSSQFTRNTSAYFLHRDRYELLS